MSPIPHDPASCLQIQASELPCIPLLQRDTPLCLLYHSEWTRFQIAQCGIFPAELALLAPQRVLALACGPGDWALDIAQADTNGLVRVTGIDRDRAMIDFARTRAGALNLASRVTFLLAEVDATLSFRSRSFDCIRIHLLGEKLEHYTSQKLLQEYWRVLRQGGTLWLSESPRCSANAPSYQKLIALLTCIDPQVGRADTAYDDPASRIERAGFTSVGTAGVDFDFSYRAPLHGQLAHHLLALFDILEPSPSLAQATCYHQLRLQLEGELNQKDFVGHWSIRDVWGQKQA